jgi:hypothetical protein
MKELLALLRNPKTQDLLCDWDEPFSRLSNEELLSLANQCEYLRQLNIFTLQVEAFLRMKGVDARNELQRRGETEQ